MNEKVVNPLELKWARQKQQDMLVLFQNIPFSELHYTSRYLSSKIGYGAFMKYVKSIENAQPKNGSLLEVAEQAQIQVEQSVLNAEALFSEMPEHLQTIDVDVELQKQGETQLDTLRAISTKLIAALQAFINGQYLNAAELHPMFKELCRLYEDFFANTKLFLHTFLLNIKNLNNVIESDKTYQQLLKNIGVEPKKAEKTKELTWIEKKHQELIHFFESPSHLELYHFARYLLQKNVHYQIFRIHVKQTPVSDFLTGTTRISNLFETAEQVTHYLKKFTPFLEQIFSEVPCEPEALAYTSISLKEFLEQLTDLKNISSILENDLHNFANNKELPEKELYLVFKTLCKTFHLFLAKTHPQQWRLITPASEHVPKDVLSKHVLPLLTLPELNVAAQVNHAWRRIAHVEIRNRLREKPNLSFWAISAHQPVAVLEECLQSDLKHQFDINRETIKGMALLHLACKRGRIGAVKSVVRSGANVSSISSGDWTPLHYACANGHLDVTQYLVDETDAKKDLTKRAQSGMTPFYLACLSGKVEMVKYLLEKRTHTENYSLPNLDEIQQSGHFELEAYLRKYLSDLFVSVEKILEAYLIECKDKDRTFFAAVSFLSFLRSPSHDALANLHKFKEPLLANASLKRLYEDCNPFFCTLIATPDLNRSSNLTLPQLIQHV